MGEPILICCERVQLMLVGGQYQFTWIGKCPRCLRRWVIECEDDENSDEAGD